MPTCLAPKAVLYKYCTSVARASGPAPAKSAGTMSFAVRLLENQPQDYEMNTLNQDGKD